MLFDESNLRVCVVGLGYVGIPLAYHFAKQGAPVCGFDIDEEKIKKLEQGIDPCQEFSHEELSSVSITYSSNPEIIRSANFIIIAVPTPIDENKKPDVSLLEKASEVVGKHISTGSIVVYESTVYPGVTEEICVPILERASGKACGRDFFVGYSPERVNPGDSEHTIDRIVKVVSGMNEEVLDAVASVYSIPCKAGVHRATSIQVAEAAKIIENIQRDLNIALVNELSLIFHRLGINTSDVLAAAATKWNFHAYKPGLVGGHCIGVDPYYLVHRAESVGYDPQILLGGRRINESMAHFVGDSVVRMMIRAEKKVKGARVLIMGLSFKEDINDLRNSKAKDIVTFLRDYGVEVWGCEPHVDDKDIEKHFGIRPVAWKDATDIDAFIWFNRHRQFAHITPADIREKSRETSVLFDVKGNFDPDELEASGFISDRL